MKLKFRSITILLIALVSVLTLAACGDGSEPAATGDDTSSTQNAGYVFVPEFIDLDVVTLLPQIIAVQEDTLFIRHIQSGAEDANSFTVLATLQTDGTGYTPIWTGRMEQETGEDGNISTSTDEIIATANRPNGGLLVVREESLHAWEEEEFHFSSTQHLIAFNANGEQEHEVNLTEALQIDPQTGLGLNQMQEMADGRVILGVLGGAYILTPEWTLESNLEWDIQSFLVTADNQIFVSIWDDASGDVGVWPFDLETGEVQRIGEVKLPGGASFHSVQTGGRHDIYLTVDQSMFGFDLETGESVRLFDWIEIDMIHATQFIVSEAGEIYFFDQELEATFDENAPSTLVRLARQDASTLPEVVEITYGGLTVDFGVRQEIVAFNRRNQGYRILVREYMDPLASDWEQAREDALRRLNMDIITGNAPDIIDFGDNLAFEQYARRGLLADIGAFLDEDVELGRDNLVEPIMNLLKVDGNLYTAMSNFSIQTLVGRADLVGPDMGWSMDEFMEALSALQPGATAFDSFVTRQQFMQRILSTNIGLFIDRETGEANFDSPLFKAYLTFAQTMQTQEELFGEDGLTPGDWIRPLPADGIELFALAETVEVAEEDLSIDILPDFVPPVTVDNWDSPYATGQVMLLDQTVWGFGELGFLEEWFGGDVTFIGYPAERGTGSVVTPQNLLGISAASDHQDIAWNFVRTVFTERYQRSAGIGFANNATVLAEQMEAAMTPQEYAPEVATQAQVDQIMALISAVDQLALVTDIAMINMIEEELLPFFAEDRGIEETVRIIQSRVQTYLSERS